MDVSASYDNDEVIIRCYRCDELVLLSLNLVYNASTATIVMWNRFQIFVYENLELECAAKVIIPEFQIHNLLITNHYLICQDSNGNIHTSTLKFKTTGQKRAKYGFQTRLIGVLVCSLYDEEQIMTLSFVNDAFFLSVHNINTEFDMEKNAIVTSKEELVYEQTIDKYFLKSFPISERHIKDIQIIFNNSRIKYKNNYQLVLLSFDKVTIYCCLYSTTMIEEEVSLVKLYTCPSELVNIDFIEIENNLKIIIGLSIGTLISLGLDDTKTAQIVHLNLALYKLIVFKQAILYTDGHKMYKAEKILSQDVEFKEIFARNVKDFVKFGDQIVCTTFNNMIYAFSIEHEKTFVPRIPATEYCPAGIVLENTESVSSILSEINKNQLLVQKHMKERNYVTALSLSNRQDIMDNIIQFKVVVYENYEDATAEHSDVVLTNHFSEYFHADSFYFLIKIYTTTEHSLHDILSSAVGDLNIHVSFIASDLISKSNTFKVRDVIRNIELLIPVKNALICSTDMRVEIKVITSLPGTFDPNNKIWAVLYRKCMKLNSDNFIKFNINPSKKICIRESRDTLEQRVMLIAENHYGSLCEFTKLTPEPRHWHMYVRLPAQYKKINKDFKSLQSTSKKVNYFLHKFTSDDFLNSSVEISLPIDEEKVVIKIDNDGFSTPLLKITSTNLKVALDIKNFLSDLIYHVFADCEQGKEFINRSFYITVENLQKSLRNYITNTASADIHALFEQFEKKIIGILPV